tara:strand:+ start:187 stop:402 length:216 start_codon:yes stop_codon:yes gene_type:complete
LEVLLKLNKMEKLITIIGELYPQDLARFLENYNINNVDEFITFLYNLDEDDIKEVESEIIINSKIYDWSNN